MSRYDLTRAELGRLFDGEPAYRVDQVWDGMYRRFLELDEVSELPRALRERLGASGALAPAFLLADEAVSDRGLTVKWLLEAADGTRVETVLMGYRDRVTVCVSSQAGCAMACGFCATGQGGFFRQLSTGEIVEQVVRAARRTAEQGWGRLGNIVLMGMGEPLANYANVRAAIGRWNTDLGIGARSITVSTVGIVPGIRKLAADPIQVNLAVSLHAANDELKRSRPDQPPLSARCPNGGMSGLRLRHPPAHLVRVGVHRGRERPAIGCEGARRARSPARSACQPHPAQPHARVSRRREHPPGSRGVPRRDRCSGSERDDPQHPGSRRERRLRAAGRLGAGGHRAASRTVDQWVGPRSATA